MLFLQVKERHLDRKAPEKSSLINNYGACCVDEWLIQQAYLHHSGIARSLSRTFAHNLEHRKQSPSAGQRQLNK